MVPAATKGGGQFSFGERRRKEGRWSEYSEHKEIELTMRGVVELLPLQEESIAITPTRRKLFGRTTVTRGVWWASLHCVFYSSV